MTDLLRFEQNGAIALVTLDRPAKRNAINADMANAIEAAVRRVEDDPAIRVAILASSSDAVFCAGADLAAVAAGDAAGMSTSDGGFAGFVYARRRTPWIAAVEGLAVAGGFEIVLACDLIVGSANARFGLPEVKRGLIAGAGGVHRLAGVLPRNVANELLASGDTIDAPRAFALGLLNRLTDPGAALVEARKLAEAIAANAPLAVQASLAAARESGGRTEEESRGIVADEFVALRQSDDFKEGPRAFVEKRAPMWTGR